jgi:hypothetical protein
MNLDNNAKNNIFNAAIYLTDRFATRALEQPGPGTGDDYDAIFTKNFPFYLAFSKDAYMDTLEMLKDNT